MYFACIHTCTQEEYNVYKYCVFVYIRFCDFVYIIYWGGCGGGARGTAGEAQTHTHTNTHTHIHTHTHTHTLTHSHTHTHTNTHCFISLFAKKPHKKTALFSKET